MEFCQKNEICGFLTNLRKHTNLSFSILFTYDGFVITNDQKERDNERDLQSLGAISAGILSLAQNFAKSFKRNTIDSGLF
ncbi:MAG: roadblock/LC7 domain-containing protein [Candidatus Lokiarchaeota archaeon]